MEYSVEMVKTLTSMFNDGTNYVVQIKGARKRYVVALTSNGNDRTYEKIVDQLKEFDSLPILGLEVDHTKEGLQVEVVTRFNDIADAFENANKYNKSTIYDSYRDKPVVALNVKN